MQAFHMFLCVMAAVIVLVAGPSRAQYGVGRELLASCSKNTKYKYYGEKYLLEESDITGKRGHKTCCWLCNHVCGCNKWTYMKKGSRELCYLYENKAPKRKWTGCKGCVVSGRVK